MTFLKIVLAGVAGAVVASVLWIVVAFVGPIVMAIAMARLSSAGAAGVGFSINSRSILVAALVGLVVGSYWQFRRASKGRLQAR
jgi:hypothetical protein